MLQSKVTSSPAIMSILLITNLASDPKLIERLRHSIRSDEPASNDEQISLNQWN
ncbi:hypothetical protein BAE44_0007891 [Dichanthelium oligosanthes]|uniref:Uncharacterized protein n=1 Tax=Dichanthelium oligosanthes TaxID=888268 RepID=A0A1E5W1G0_9POAL|nr:hypothetical protein BAE44_0007891 [Dichanthelium oligosanthes]